MVVALFNTNQTYLSLPDGEATAAGLIAMMSDHYNIMEGEDIHQESSDVHKAQRHGNGKPRIGISKGSDGCYFGHLCNWSDPLEHDCFSLLVDGNKPHPVGKRTPRVPVDYTQDEDGRVDTVSPNNPVSDLKIDDSSAEGAHIAESSSADAPQRKGSPEALGIESKKAEQIRSSPQRVERERTESDMADANSLSGRNKCFRAAATNQFSSLSATVMDTSGAGISETQLKVEKLEEKSENITKSRSIVRYVRKAFGATKQVDKISYVNDSVPKEAADGRTPSSQRSKEKSAQLPFGDSGMHVKEQKQYINSTCNPIISGSVPIDHAVESMTSVRRDNGLSTIFGVDAAIQKKGEKNGLILENKTSFGEEQQTFFSEGAMQCEKPKFLPEKDTDCMPLNLLENAPEDSRKQSTLDGIAVSHFAQLKENMPIHSLELPSGISQSKGDTMDVVAQAGDLVNGFAAAESIHSEACASSQIQEKEPIIGSLGEATHAYRKKDASALLSFTQRSICHGNGPHLWLEFAGETLPAESPNYFRSFDQSEDSGSNVVQIVDNTRLKARELVDATVQAMSSVEEGEDAFSKRGEGLKSSDSQHPKSDSSLRSSQNYPTYPGDGNSAYSAPKCSCALHPAATVHSLNPRVDTLSNASESQIPSKLVSACAAAFLMIQACAEKKHPPAKLAEILDCALRGLQPMSPRNLPIYNQINTCMGIIKSQMLALIPTPTPAFSAELFIL